MIAVAAVAVCAILLPFVGGRLSSLAQLRLKHEGLLVGLFLLQGVLRGRFPGIDEASAWAIAVWGAACLALVLLLLPSRGLPGVPVLIVGLAANLWVTLVNQGMPYVALDGGAIVNAGRFYHLASTATSFAWMGDVVPDPSMRSLLSLGDLLLFVGMVVVVLSAAVEPQSHGDNIV